MEDQAAVIREAAGLVLDGWSLENIARRLRERGVHGAHRVKVRDEDGEVVTGEVVDDYIEKVVIERARPGLQRFDSDRVKAIWRKPLHARPGG
ncbi:recombinase family protein [Micromonospora thermarum]|uniref:recombinase family protein n=1 Tax=Micromonospora thermarum TaxID=2720024 RepID=UPI001F0E7E6A|nr:recombinase family protein [Micromonospora thermarum]